MKVLVIGSTGYIGSVVLERLTTARHTPVAMVRQLPARPGSVPTVVGSLTDLDSLGAAITDDVDAVVHAAAPTSDWETDLAALRTLSASLAGRTLVYLSGVWVLGDTNGPAAETATPQPAALVSGRPRLEEHVRTAADVRGVVIRPGIVHGRGGGIASMMVGWAHDTGTGRYVGEPTTRWSTVHVDDLADLVVLALERAGTGALLHGVAEPAVPVKEIAAAADRAAGGGGGAESWPETEAAAELGEQFAAALALDQEVVAPASRALGWEPTGPGIVEDLTHGSYRTVRSG